MPVKAETLTLKLRKALDQLPYVPWALALVWNTTRGLTLARGGLLVIQGLLPVATVYLTRPLVDNLAKAVGGGVALENIEPILVLVLLMASVLLLSEVLQGVNNWIRTAQSEQVQDYVRSLIHQKSMTVDLAFYESPQFYDNLHRARSEAASRPLSLMDNMGSLLQNGITLFAMAALLFRFGPWLPIALVASTIPAVAIVFHQNKRQHAQWVQTTADTRRAWYCDWVLTSKENAAELRLFGLGPHFQSAYQAVRNHLRKLSLKLVRDRALAELGARTGSTSDHRRSHGFDGVAGAHGFGNAGRSGLFLSSFQSGAANDALTPGKRESDLQQLPLFGEPLRLSEP